MSWIEDLVYSSQGFELKIKRWDFPDSGISCVFGESGSGKTTLLQIMAGLLQSPHKLCIKGEMVSEVIPIAKNIGFVFQDYSLFGHLTVFENLSFVAEAKGLHYDMWKSHAEALLQKLELTRLKDQRANTLSGGEQQRVAIARALVTKPRMVLMDEPLSALDENRRDDARELIRTVAADFNVPFVLVTHDLRDVRYLSHHLLILKNGKALGSGPTLDVLNKPSSLEVATAIPENQIIATHEGHIVAKPWSFLFGKDGTLQGEITSAFDDGPQMSYRIRLSSGQIVKAMAPLGSNYKGKVHLKLDRESVVVFQKT